MQKSAFLIALLIIPIIGLAQQKISWKEGERLTWADFRAKPDNATNLKAITDSGMGISFTCEGGKPVVSITCNFNPERSWTKEHQSEALLRHEQLHFDITELYARKIRKLLSTFTNCVELNKKIKQLYDDNFKACDAYQDRYDRETNHSIDAEKQTAWEAKVKAELDDLKDWATR